MIVAGYAVRSIYKRESCLGTCSWLRGTTWQWCVGSNNGRDEIKLGYWLQVSR